MTRALIKPTTSFNFLVTLWDVHGPEVASIDSASPFASIAGSAVNLAAQFLLGAFSEVDGLNSQLETENYQEGGRNARPRRFAKTNTYENLVLKRGVTINTDLWDWHQQVSHAAATSRIRKSGVVILFDRGGPNLTGAGVPALDRLPVAAWYFQNALPQHLKGPRLDAKENALAIESLDIAHEGLQRVSLSMIPGLGDASAAFGGLIGVAGSAFLGGVPLAG